MSISVIGLVLSLLLLIYLAFKGHSTIWIAPVCSLVIAIFGSMNLVDTILKTYMAGAAKYFQTWFPVFFLGAVYGAVMDKTGAAKSLANKVIQIIGEKHAIAVVVAIGLLLTYGGVSLFVVVFVTYPIAYELYKAANLSRTLIPGAIALGTYGVTMTCFPGTPSIQNLIPTEYLGTTPTAAPLLGIIAGIMIFIPGYIYLQHRAKQTRAAGMGFEEDEEYEAKKVKDDRTYPSWHWLSGLIPIFFVILLLTAFKTPVVLALLAGILLCCLLNINQGETLLDSFTEGAKSSMLPILATCSVIGYGAVVKASPGFTVLTELAMNVPGGVLISEVIAINILSGATGSSSAGLAISLSTLGPTWLAQAAAQGISPEIVHRIATVASGGLDTLPHNAPTQTVLALSHCTYKQSYKDICYTSLVFPLITATILAVVLTIIY
ncbi:MAG: hypothetical protein LKE33_02130 [Acidaminococcus sp.]|jgi:H+/gluconate symporter-like permease|nr:hypothetical protein [Acidaminococcus sp.]MCI2100789.1 hypothetical protein [Acidaminococcus sp.]MCI2115110.1 hypothetical protein [Acidaminococcus sp.]MCI2117186.1 hypothetical protein [Acidaminococcus sp.]